MTLTLNFQCALPLLSSSGVEPLPHLWSPIYNSDELHICQWQHHVESVNSLYHSRDVSGRNRCTNSPCSHLCLAKPNGFICACPDSMTPLNGTTCQGNYYWVWGMGHAAGLWGTWGTLLGSSVGWVGNLGHTAGLWGTWSPLLCISVGLVGDTGHAAGLIGWGWAVEGWGRPWGTWDIWLVSGRHGAHCSAHN